MKIEEVVFGIKHNCYYFRRMSQGDYQEVFLDNPTGVLRFAKSVLEGAEALIYGITFEFPLPKRFLSFKSEMLRILGNREYGQIIAVKKFASKKRQR